MEKENILTPDNRVVEKNRMKRFINRVRKNIIPAVSGVITMTAIECTNVMAADYCYIWNMVVVTILHSLHG